MLLDVRYAFVDDAAVAYAVLGESGPDILITPPVNSHLDVQSELPEWVDFHSRLSAFARTIVFDKRGTGLSDALARTGVSTLEERMDDMLSIMEDAGSRRATILGYGEGGPLACLFAATYPDRTAGLILVNTTPCLRRGPDYPWGWDQGDTPMDRWRTPYGPPNQQQFQRIGASFSERRVLEWGIRWVRSGSTPGIYRALQAVAMDIDVRGILPAISAPALVMHRAGNQLLDPGNARYLAEHIRDARLVELPGDEHYPFMGHITPVVEEIEEFVTGRRTEAEPERVLATVLFTDIVDSTQTAARLGDHEWKALLTRHHGAVRAELTRHRGREIATAGDGFMATFDGPARAVQCAWALHRAVAPLGLQLRAGLHTGEIERHGDTIAGIGVHIAARVAAMAGPGDVLVSRTVKDLVAGSGIAFADRGAHALKGVPGRWDIYAAEE